MALRASAQPWPVLRRAEAPMASGFQNKEGNVFQIGEPPLLCQINGQDCTSVFEQSHVRLKFLLITIYDLCRLEGKSGPSKPGGYENPF